MTYCILICNSIILKKNYSKLTKEANILAIENMYFSCHIPFSLFGCGLGRLFLQLTYINVSFILCKGKLKYIWKICRDMQLIR